MNALTLFDLFEQAERDEKLPPASDFAACCAAFAACIERFDEAVMCGNTDAAVAARADAEEIIVHGYQSGAAWPLERGRHAQRFKPCHNDYADAIMQATAAPRGSMPKWGQAGLWVIETQGAPYAIEMDGLCGIMAFGSLLPHFGFHALDARQLSLSETGYRSCFSGLTMAPSPALTVEQAVIAYMGRLAASKDGRPRRIRKDHWDSVERYASCWRNGTGIKLQPLRELPLMDEDDAEEMSDLEVREDFANGTLTNCETCDRTIRNGHDCPFCEQGDEA